MGSSNKYPRGLPPQYPPRRGSNTPISPLASHKSPSTPNRSRSLDGLLDSTEAPVTATNAALIERIPSSAARSCEELDKEKQKQKAVSEDSAENENVLENSTDSNDADKVSMISNSSEKRKRNFMDRCVNKVRSFIKK